MDDQFNIEMTYWNPWLLICFTARIRSPWISVNCLPMKWLVCPNHGQFIPIFCCFNLVTHTYISTITLSPHFQYSTLHDISWYSNKKVKSISHPESEMELSPFCMVYHGFFGGPKKKTTLGASTFWLLPITKTPCLAPKKVGHSQQVFTIRWLGGRGLELWVSIFQHRELSLATLGRVL